MVGRREAVFTVIFCNPGRAQYRSITSLNNVCKVTNQWQRNFILRNPYYIKCNLTSVSFKYGNLEIKQLWTLLGCLLNYKRKHLFLILLLILFFNLRTNAYSLKNLWTLIKFIFNPRAPNLRLSFDNDTFVLFRIRSLQYASL